MTYVFSPSENQLLMCAAFVFCLFVVAAVAAHIWIVRIGRKK